MQSTHCSKAKRRIALYLKVPGSRETSITQRGCRLKSNREPNAKACKTKSGVTSVLTYSTNVEWSSKPGGARPQFSIVTVCPALTHRSITRVAQAPLRYKPWGQQHSTVVSGEHIGSQQDTEDTRTHYTVASDDFQTITGFSIPVSAVSREHLVPWHSPHRMGYRAGSCSFLPSGFTRGNGRCGFQKSLRRSE